jgi:glycerophosphoryl diester phosphodiesterase
MFQIRSAVILLVLVVALISCGRPKPTVVGHRGDSAHNPENTLISFQRAIEKGAEGIETDLRLTADGHIVLIHDDKVDRTTNGTGLVIDYTLEEIQKLDAGSWFSPEFADQKVPSFRELFELMRNMSSTIPIIMDLKVENLGAAIAALANELGVQNQIIASCWTSTQIADIGAHLNLTVKQRLTGSVPLNDTKNYLNSEILRGVQGFSINYGKINAEFVMRSQNRLMPVFVWTLNQPELIQAAINNNVDGVLTDDVSMALAVVNNQGNASPIQAPVEAPAEAGHMPVSTPVAQSGNDNHFGDLIFVGIAAVVIGFLVGFVPLFITYRNFKKKYDFEALN